MADHTDFASLYRELGIRGACTPDAFRRAYRRRVSQLHPDQRGSQDDIATLQELNRLYDAALDFLQAHGRLPGSAAVAPPAQAHPAAASACTHARAVAPQSKPAAGAGGGDTIAFADASAGTARLSRYFILLAVFAIAVLVVSALKGMVSVDQETQHATDAVAPPVEPIAAAASIALGMGKRQAEAIQGSPVGSHAVRWDYGPSWIDFKCGDVVTDWYSSPLRPLRTATPHPTTRDWDRFDAARPPGC